MWFGLSALSQLRAILAVCPAHTISLTPPMTQWSCWPEATAALHVHATSKITVHPHAIRSRVRLPRASQPCSYPQAGTSSDRARCPTASGLSARGHGRAEVATVSPAAATERRESREARTHSSSPLTPTTLAWIPPSPRYLPLSFQASFTYSKRAH